MRDRVRARWLAGGIASLLAASSLAFAACGGDDEAASGGSAASSITGPEATLYEQAKEEGGLTWYTSAPTTQLEATSAAFRKRYPGVEVRVARLASGPLETRYAQERESGAATADVITNAADPKFDATAAEKKWAEPNLDVPALKAFPEKWVKNGLVTVGLLQLVIGYNKNIVPEEIVPKGWEDTLRPEFKEKMTFGDPRASVTFLALAQLWRDEYGDDFLRKFAAQKPTVVPSIVPAAGELAAGGTKLIVPGSYIALQPTLDKGAPIGIIPMSPTFITQYLTWISTASKSPNAARLFVNFLLTRDGQAAFNSGGGSSPLTDDLPDTNPVPPGSVLDVDIVPKAQENEESTLELLGLN
jgi:ABC-type Fe3+ transport system substrate-binding protein